MVRSRTQLEQTARAMIRQAYAQGWNADDLVIDFVTEAMGEEHRPLIGRVFTRDFKATQPI